MGTMEDEYAWPVSAVIFLTALGTRLVGVAVTTVTSLNPYAQSDATRFTTSAAEAAATVASGQLPYIPTDPNRIVTLWGLFLSPLWLLPGPNRLYGRLFTAILGAITVFTLYRLGKILHSREAGFIAVLPLICYPSYILTHSTVLRESFVLAGLIGSTYLITVRPTSASWLFPWRTRYALAGLLVALVTIVRWENLPLYVLTIGTGLLIRYRRVIPRPRLAAAITGLTGIVGAWFSRPLIQAGLDFLTVKRRRRSEGRTVYLADFLPDTLPKAILFAPIGAVYFLFTPFPWMVATLADGIVFVEALSNLVAAGLAILGIPVLWRRSKPVVVALVVGFLAAAVLYGLANANVGTNVRQRQMFLWVLFLFAGVTVAERFDVGRLTRLLDR